MENTAIPITKSTKILIDLQDLKVDERMLYDEADRSIVMQKAGELKRYMGLLFSTSKKGQPEGKFAVWRIK